MKTMLLSKFTHRWSALTILLMMAGSSMSYGMVSQNYRQTKWERNHMNFRFMAPAKKETDGWYQPPRSPGYNEDFGS